MLFPLAARLNNLACALAKVGAYRFLTTLYSGIGQAQDDLKSLLQTQSQKDGVDASAGATGTAVIVSNAGYGGADNVNHAGTEAGAGGKEEVAENEEQTGDGRGRGGGGGEFGRVSMV